VSVYLRLETSPSLTIFPEVNLGYMTGTAKIEAVFGGGVSLFFSEKVRLMPSFTTVDGNTTWGVMVWLVMPGN